MGDNGKTTLTFQGAWDPARSTRMGTGGKSGIPCVPPPASGSGGDKEGTRGDKVADTVVDKGGDKVEIKAGVTVGNNTMGDKMRQGSKLPETMRIHREGWRSRDTTAPAEIETQQLFGTSWKLGNKVTDWETRSEAR